MFSMRSFKVPFCVIATLLVCDNSMTRAAEPPAFPAAIAEDYAKQIRPLLKEYCFSCHSAEKHKGSLNLEKFESLHDIRKELKAWEGMSELVEAGEMPPEGKKQPTSEERKHLLSWVRKFLDAEAIARAGDPGFVPLRRLSNAEFNYTIRDLTGVDLQPAREFPADGAGGEGFTNAAESLADMSPTLLNKYLLAAKEIAGHAVLLPDGFRFSPSKTRRDWTVEVMEQIRQVYGREGADGRLPLRPYLVATIRHRDALLSGTMTVQQVAEKEKLNAKYLGILWKTLTDKQPAFPLDRIRADWMRAGEQDANTLIAAITVWQNTLWKIVKIGSYRDGATTRQVAADPVPVEMQTLRLAFKPTPGQSDVTAYLATRELSGNADGRRVVWHRPRFEGVGKPALLLKNYAQFGSAYEVDYPAFFADSPKYLAAVAGANDDRKLTVEAIAKESNLDPTLLKRWVDLLALAPRGADEEVDKPGRAVPALALTLLDEKVPANAKYPAIKGWRNGGAELPTVLSNASDKEEHIPGNAMPHRVVVHPMPAEYVASTWTSPIAGRVRVTASVIHVHAGCGNGVAWWIERRRGNHAEVIGEGVVRIFGHADITPRNLTVEKGDVLILAVDAHGDHGCDLSEMNLTVSESAEPKRVWDLSGDVADHILDANPHADRLGNAGVWAFVKGPTRPLGNLKAAEAAIPANSSLGKWRWAATHRTQRADAEKLAEEVKTILSGPRPAKNGSGDQVLYDNLVSVNSVLMSGLDLKRFVPARSEKIAFGLPAEKFGHGKNGTVVDEASFIAPANGATEIRLPAGLLQDREFVVDVAMETPGGDRVVQSQLSTTPPAMDGVWPALDQLVALPLGKAYAQFHDGLTQFRNCFPMFISFPQIMPTDEIVCLKQFHRDDEPFMRLFQSEAEQKQLDHLWAEHRFISQWPVNENKYLPLFIGFVTQDQPKAMLIYYEGMREPFRVRAEEFENELHAAVPRHLDALLEFSAKAFRRPLSEGEKAGLLGLYRALREKGVGEEEAFRGVLARVLVAPAFLFHLEQPPAGKLAAAINDWELASRLSYFLSSSAPDDELRKAAASGTLREPNMLESQTLRLLRDDRIRALAVEFGTQWIHVRGFDEFKEKNEKLFPTFNESLRGAIYEESILFFQDLFQNDQPLPRLIDADYTYLNESLAKHYAIPNVTGPQWRKVEGVGKFGRGGILGLASVQSRQAGASRTSPVLRGNWVVETLLGEKLPRPPADVPKLPEEEGAAGLTTRQMVEKHTSVASCQVCHQRIDPLGFSFERYDAIGRWREKEASGMAIDASAKLKDGTALNGIDGLRGYLLTKKKDVVVRLFCKRLLGYALGRAATLSDHATIDEMVAELNKSDGKVSAAVLTIVHSPQFRSIRGAGYADEE